MELLSSKETPSEVAILECFNILMSAYAERGDVFQALGLLEIMKEADASPNADSYSFALESLGKDIHRRKKSNDPAWLHKNIELSSSLLTQMEEDHVSPSSDVVRNYVELLCLTDEIDTANSVVDDFLGRGDTESVNNITLYRVALANADEGNFKKAKEMAALTSEHIPVLHRKIKSKEQRTLYLESIQDRKGAAVNASQDTDLSN